jgi:acetyl-CoA synthetase
MSSSVGEAWDISTYNWYFNAIGGRKLPIVNHSGGTEVGNLLACVPVRPIVGGKFNTAVPGVLADVVDAAGHSIRDVSGDLVVRGPFLGMTQGLWHESDRYMDAYWLRHPGLWDQGDSATAGLDGYWTLDGRSDERLKVSGRGVMPDEVEQVVIDKLGVAAVVAITVPVADSGSVLAVVLEATAEVDGDDLEARAIQAVREELGSAFAPRFAVVVPRLPRTQNGKVLRRAVAAVAEGQPFDVSNLAEIDVKALSQVARTFNALPSSGGGA